MTPWLRGLLGATLLLALAACEQAGEAPRDSSQAYYFLEALKQVESGGKRLQDGVLDATQLAQALASLDAGLRLAFHVERPFLDALDLRLGKNFERYFIRGVENYRVGIEAGDEAQQREGLRLLRQWAEFWESARPAVLERLQAQ